MTNDISKIGLSSNKRIYFFQLEILKYFIFQFPKPKFPNKFIPFPSHLKRLLQIYNDYNFGH
jgi:hypothetical protein